MWVWALWSVAQAGYGDAVDGYPNLPQRALHLWTNAARVDPEAFEAYYEIGGCKFSDFSTDEQTPKPPLIWNYSLNDAAQFHTDDMVDNGCFQHESCDGTPFATRLATYYPSSSVGENIAYGYGGPFNTMFEGWMCSHAGHRQNIMSGDWIELGTGANGDDFTQDFGTEGGAAYRPIAMGFHELPSDDAGKATFWADGYDASGADPDEYIVVLDGVASALDVAYGTGSQGIFTATVDVNPANTCHQYYFQATYAGVATRYPETGSWTFADCPYGDGDDPIAGWIDQQMGIAGRDDLTPAEIRDKFKLIGCDSTGGAGLPAWLVGLSVAWLTRRGSPRTGPAQA